MTMLEFIIKGALCVVAIIIISIGLVWAIGGTVGTRLHRWRPDDTDAEQRARDWVLGDHPDGTDDDPMWAPWDVALIAQGICPKHAPSKLGSDECDDDCPTAISKTVAAEAMDALTANVLDGTPLPEPTVRYVITRPAIGWLDHEGTKGEWIRLECEFGLRDDNPGPDAQPVVDVIAWNGAVMGKIVRPWTDPNLEVEPDPRRTDRRAVARSWADALGMDQADDRQVPRTGGSAL